MTMRSLDTRFWSDGWVRHLNPLDRYLFLYLLTNDKTNWCGVYELDLGMMAFECGLDERDLERALLPRLIPKIIYVEGWVYIPNFPKYHLNGTDATKKGYEKAFSQVPERIRLIIKEIEKQGVVPPTHPSSALAFTSAFISSAEPLRVVSFKEEDTEERPKRQPKYPNAKEVFSWFPKPEKAWEINTTELKHAELLCERGEAAVKKALKYHEAHKDDEGYGYKVVKPSQLEGKWNDIAEYARRA